MLWGTTTIPTVRPAMISPDNQPTSVCVWSGSRRSDRVGNGLLTVSSNPPYDREETLHISQNLNARQSVRQAGARSKQQNIQTHTTLGICRDCYPILYGDNRGRMVRPADDALSETLRPVESRGHGRREARGRGRRMVSVLAESFMGESAWDSSSRGRAGTKSGTVAMSQEPEEMTEANPVLRNGRRGQALVWDVRGCGTRSASRTLRGGVSREDCECRGERKLHRGGWRTRRRPSALAEA